MALRRVCSFLRKPFQLTEVVRMVAAILWAERPEKLVTRFGPLTASRVGDGGNSPPGLFVCCSAGAQSG